MFTHFVLKQIFHRKVRKNCFFFFSILLHLAMKLIGRSENVQPIGVTVHTCMALITLKFSCSYVGKNENELQWIGKKHNFSWPPCILKTSWQPVAGTSVATRPTFKTQASHPRTLWGTDIWYRQQYSKIHGQSGCTLWGTAISNICRYIQ